MSKKSKKQSRKVSASTIRAPGSAANNYQPVEVEWKPDYSQTIKDLRRIGILAGGFFIVLIVLSIFLR